MKSIIFITDSLYAGGSNKVCSELENLFFINGYNTLTISLDVADNNIYKILGKVENTGGFGKKSFPFKTYLIILQNIFKTIKILNNNNNNNNIIIISHSARSNLINLITKYFVKSKRILVHHEDTKNFIKSQSFFNRLSIKIINKIVFMLKSKNDIFVAVSESTKKGLEENFKINGDLLVIHNGINFKKINKLSQEETDINFPFIINVGTLCKIKNQELLIKAFYKIHKKIKEHLLLIGDGPDYDKLKTLANKLGISNKVHFMLFQINPYKFISKSSLFIFTSKTESFGLVLLEAMFLGIPCITSKNAGALEIVGNSKGALILKDFSEELLSNEIIHLLSDEKKAFQYSQNGINRAKDFSIYKQYEEYLKII